MDEVEIVVTDRYVSRGGFGAAKKGMKDLAGDAKSAGQEAGQQFSSGLGDGVSKSKGKAAAGIKDMFSSLAAGGALAGAAGLVGSALVDGIKGKLEKSAIQGQMKAQFGLTEKDAAASGKTAGALYASGLGESVAQTSQVVGNVRASFSGLATVGTNSLESISKGALTVSKVFGVDVNDVIRSTSQLMKNGLAPNASAALDIIAKGFQNGLDSSGDFLDTLNEYSPYFRQLGLSAEEGLGIINQMMKAGARDTDAAADSIKEFGIRAIDGSKTTIQAFQDLGFNAQEMASKIAQGGPAAKEAFGQVITALQGMKDPVAQNTAGVALFGTQWEDTVRAILPNIDLTKTGFENVKGSVDGMNKAITETDSSKVEQLGRKIDALKESAAGAVLAIAKLADGGSPDQKRPKNSNVILNLTLEANAQPAEDVLEQFKQGVNRTSGTVNINGNDNSAVSALEEIQHEIDMGKGTVNINGNQVPALEAKQAVLDQINAGAGMVAINGNQIPAGEALAQFLGYANRSTAVVSVQAYTAAAEAAIDYAARNRQTTVFVNTVGTVNGSSVVHGYAHGGITSTAATGGQRGGNVTMNERGGEQVSLPDGSRVLTAEASRAWEKNMIDGSGTGGEVVISFDPSGINDRSFLGALIGMLRVNGKKVPGLTT